MRCANCAAKDRDQPEICETCRRMQRESLWQWEIDTGHRYVRCPKCQHALSIPLWCYELPYRFCAWCGEKMVKDWENEDEL